MTTLHPVVTNSGTSTSSSRSNHHSKSQSQSHGSSISSGESDGRANRGSSESNFNTTNKGIHKKLDNSIKHSPVTHQTEDKKPQGEVVVVESRRLSALSQYTNHGRHSLASDAVGKDTATAKTTETQLSSSASIIDFVDSTIVIHPRGESSQTTFLLPEQGSVNFVEATEEEEGQQEEVAALEKETAQAKVQQQVVVEGESKEEQEMHGEEKEKTVVEGNDANPKKELKAAPDSASVPVTHQASSTATATTAPTAETAETAETPPTMTNATTPRTPTNTATTKPATSSAVRMGHPPRSPRRAAPPSSAMKRRFEGLQRVARFQETSMHSIPPPDNDDGVDGPGNASNHTEISYYSTESLYDEDDTTAGGSGYMRNSMHSGKSSAMGSDESSADFCGSSSEEDPDHLSRSYRERLERATSRHSMYSLSSAFTLCDLGSISEVSTLGFDDVEYETNDISDDSCGKGRENHELVEIFCSSTSRRNSLLALQASIGEITIEVTAEEEETTEGDDVIDIMGDDDEGGLDDDDDESSEPPRFLSRQRMYKSFMVDDTRSNNAGDGRTGERPSFRPTNSTRYLFETTDDTDELDLSQAKDFLTAMAAEEQQRQFHLQKANPDRFDGSFGSIHDDSQIAGGATATTTLTAMGHARPGDRRLRQSDYTEELVTSDDDDVAGELMNDQGMAARSQRRGRPSRQISTATTGRESVLSCDYTEVEVEDEFEEEEVLSDYEEEVIEEVVVDED